MSILNLKELIDHHGHNIVCVSCDKDNVSIECVDCSEVLLRLKIQVSHYQKIKSLKST